jgi:hypothetical protein
MIEARTGGTATLLLNGRVLNAGGTTTPGSDSPGTTPSAALYDPVSGTWRQTRSLVAARNDHSATLLLDGRVLVAGRIVPVHGSPSMPAGAELYDPGSGIWTGTASMVEVLYGHSATLLLDGTVLVVGGYTGIGGSFPPASAELFDQGGGP